MKVINGHFYFNNKVNKFRYDLMLEKKTEMISEEQFINFYDDVLDLKNG